MRVVFLGTAAFAVPALRACATAGHEVAVVVTQPDRPGDRGRPAPRPVAAAAAGLKLAILRPPRLREPATIDSLLAFRPQALVVAAYGQILPGQLLDGAPLGGINVHASLLPRWRGAAPVSAAILAGDGETGVSIMCMDSGLDTGPVYAARATPIGERETAPQLGERLAHLGAALLVEVLARLERGEQPPPQAQDEAAATLAPRLSRADGLLDWSQLDAPAVDRHVRALQPWPGSTAPLAGEPLRLLSGEPVPESAAAAVPGTLLSAGQHSVEVACRAGVYRVDAVQPAGRRAMDAAAWLRGRRLRPPVPAS
ncbi:MAG TPA: methionyl-tRNA formyltransferase [Candidatus Dormibacteraeota bacterium]